MGCKMKTLIALIFFSASLLAADPFREIGKITAQNSLGWDASDGATGYNVYVADTTTLNFVRVATITGETKWRGDATKELNGVKAVYVTAFNDLGESDPSETVLVTFRAGVPLPPTNIAIFQLLTAAATNSLPTLPQ